jgi:glycosyltransferase involved in cell wall biosynthesis
MQAEALVAPVRFGAGVKGKITQALASGLPVVTSSIGAEGLGGLDGVNMLIGDDPEALAERIISVVDDPELWSALSAGGQKLITEKCSLQVLDARIREVLDGAVGEPYGVVR